MALKQIFQVLVTLAVTLAATTLPGRAERGPSLTIRYRMSVEVEMNGEIKRGSGVIESRFHTGGMQGQRSLREIWYGEAVTIQLAPSVYLLVLHVPPPGPPYFGSNLIAEACGQPQLLDIDKAGQWFAELDARFATRCILPPQRWPIIAITSTPADPDAMALYTASNLPAGISLESITVERTDQDVTYGIVDILPWARSHGGTTKFRLEEGGYVTYLRASTFYILSEPGS